MKIYTCPKECGCGAFSALFMQLRQRGIEPHIADDDPEECYFEFNSRDWSLAEERKFNLDIFRGSQDDRRPCIVCYSRGYSEAQNRQCENCGEHLVLCQTCFELQRIPLAACPFCKTITHDEANAQRWQSQSLEEIIPEMLLGHHQGMNFARLSQNLESVYGKCLDRRQLLVTLRRLVESGTVVKKSNRRYGV